MKKKPESFWASLGERRALMLFHAASVRVPAYKAFLRANRIDHRKIHTIADFRRVPFTDKKNYIAAYPVATRCWDGRLTGSTLIASSSGTSGTPTFWPRGGYAEFEAGVIHGSIYRDLWHIGRRSTLIIIGFPMGSYVSGIATLLPTWLAGQHPEMGCTVISCGNRKDDILDKVRLLAPSYDQVILAGHPFLIKDVIETGRDQGIPWRDMHVKTFLCSEGFSEGWRTFLMRQAGMDSGPGLPVMSTYGSSETLLIGHETPASVALRKTLRGPIVPNIFAYNPLLRYIEAADGELLFTCAPGIPLIRFNLHDSGTVIPEKNFVTLAGRADHTAIFNAANIYPEHIHAALNRPSFLPAITGKFLMRTAYDKKYDTALHVHVELRPAAKPGAALAAAIREHVITTLRRVNSEFADMERAHMANKKSPPPIHIALEPYQEVRYFPAGMKPKYIERNSA